ncbi:uncharacterized protein G2W53_032880 [Senna tora]|uniref:Uncharacterized protein n=1 Tax=Senna tora TaxID=362788 RepID=A0A834T8K3_9FABA|nr:uncharacterized protein G2W53_032880 [Senna tora]
MYASSMLISFYIEEIIQFRYALGPEELTSLVNPNIYNSYVTSSPLEITLNGWLLSRSHDLNFVAYGEVLRIIAYAIKVNYEKGWFYDSYKKCAKMLEPDEKFFTTANATIWFKIELSVLDDSRTVNITLICERSTSRFVHLLRYSLFHLCGCAIEHANKNGEAAILISPKNVVDLIVHDDSLDTSVQLREPSHIEIDGSRLSFTDFDASPSSITSSTRKRFLADANSNCSGFDEEIEHVGTHLKKIKLNHLVDDERTIETFSRIPSLLSHNVVTFVSSDEVVLRFKNFVDTNHDCFYMRNPVIDQAVDDFK